MWSDRPLAFALALAALDLAAFGALARDFAMMILSIVVRVMLSVDGGHAQS
jgi:hypothetical protein